MIEIGDVVKLRPSIFENEFRDNRNNWSNKFMYEDTFNFVSIWFDSIGQEGDMAKTIFGASESRVIRIEHAEDGQPVIVITDLFRIIFPQAVSSNELSIAKFEEGTFRQFKSDRHLIEDLEFFEQEYLKGLFSIMERENNKLDKYRFHFHMMKREGKWLNPR